MVEIRPVGASSKVNQLIHADAGWGKTSYIGSGGSTFKILLMRPPIDHVDPIVGSGVQEMVVKNWEDIFEGLDYMRHNGPDWDIFAMDSISLLQDVGLDDVYIGMLDAKQAKEGPQARKNREMFGPDKGEYRVNMWRLAQWVRHAVGEEQFHLIITAHSFWHTEGDNEYLAPWIQGKGMVSKICGMMNIIGYGDLVEKDVRGQAREHRVLHWNKTADYYAKNQFKLPDGSSTIPEGETWNPTLPDVMEAIMKGRAVTRGRRAPAQAPTTRPGRPSGRPSARR